ncbi:MAG: glycosyltransferase [Elusimicrobiaceae bacterium]|jgi:glycosyltransferase involved in cell wall biosynthesis
MKILYIITSTTRGGAENTLFTLLSRVDKMIFQPAGVISLKPRGPVADKIEELGIPVTSLDMGYLPSLFDAGRLKREIARLKPDIVHAFLFRAIQYARAAKKENPFKLIASPRVNYRTRNPVILFKDRLSRDADDLVICESDSSREFFLTGQKYDPARVITIRNGIDSEFWRTDAEARSAMRFKADIADDELLLFSSGRLDRQKGYEYLIRALALVKDKTPRLKTVIAGQGPMREKLGKLVSELKLDRVVRFAGEQADIKAWLSAADIFALSSLWEGVPNSLLEAMSAGKPCVATRVDGVCEVARENTDALLAAPGDPRSLSEKILKLYENAGLRRELGGAARESILENRSMPDMIAAYENAYRQLV